jgi:hypothetical protein
MWSIFRRRRKAAAAQAMRALSTVDRPATSEEVAVIVAALECAAVAPEYRQLAERADGLHVVARCPCGCASVDFAKEGDESGRSVVVADTYGTTPGGGTVGLMVWGTPDRITGLEVYGLDAADDGLRLPLPASLVPCHAPS